MGTAWRTRLVHRTSHGALYISYGIHPKNKSVTYIGYSRALTQKIYHSKYFINRFFHLCHTRFNSCAVKPSTFQPTSHTMKCTQGGTEIPSKYFCKSNPPKNTSEDGTSRTSPTHKRKASNQPCRTSEGSNHGGIPRLNPADEPSKNQFKNPTK